MSDEKSSLATTTANVLVKRWKRLLRAAPPWSSLRTLGQSKILSLTALTPVFGVLILFNEEFVRWLQINAAAIGVHPDIASKATLKQIQFIYLGLLSIGSASFCFTIKCPIEIKHNATAQDWAISQQPVMSRSWRKSIFARIMNRYIFYSKNFVSNEHFPPDANARFENMIGFLCEDFSFEYLESINVTSHDVKIDLDAVIRALKSGKTKESLEFRKKIIDKFDEYQADLMYIDYRLTDYSSADLRLVIMFLYSLGFFSLAFPSIVTAVRVLWLILSR